MTRAFIRILKNTPATSATTRSIAPCGGRTNPRSRHRVPDTEAQMRTSAAPARLPVRRITMIVMIATDPAARVVLLESVDETNSPARINWRPTELALRLRVRAATDLGHYRHAGLANHELSQPVGNFVRWFCLDGLGECR